MCSVATPLPNNFFQSDGKNDLRSLVFFSLVIETVVVNLRSETCPDASKTKIFRFKLDAIFFSSKLTLLEEFVFLEVICVLLAQLYIYSCR